MECVDCVWILIQANQLGKKERETMRKILLLTGYLITFSNYCYFFRCDNGIIVMVKRLSHTKEITD